MRTGRLGQGRRCSNVSSGRTWSECLSARSRWAARPRGVCYSTARSLMCDAYRKMGQIYQRLMGARSCRSRRITTRCSALQGMRTGGRSGRRSECTTYILCAFPPLTSSVIPTSRKAAFIARAFRKGGGSQERTAAVNEACKVLNDPSKPTPVAFLFVGLSH